MQAHQQEVPVLGEPEDGLTAALCRITHAFDLDGVDQAGLGTHGFFTQHAEIVSFHFVAIDHLVAHALGASGHVILQGQLVGRLVQQAAIQRQAHRGVAVTADHLLGAPVEVVLDLLALAQAVAFIQVSLRQEDFFIHAQGALFGQAGDQHGGFKIELPQAVIQRFKAAFGAAADGQLLPVGGVAGGEGFQLDGQCRQAQKR